MTITMLLTISENDNNNHNVVDNFSQRQCQSQYLLLIFHAVVALTFFLKNAFSIQHWEQLHSFPSLQLNLFPFWRNSHFHIDKIILFWFGAQSAQLQTSFEMGREKSSNLDFEQNFGSNSNLTSWLPDWKFWKRAKYQWFLRKRQMESIFPPIPLHSFLLHFSSALLRPVSLFKVIPGRRGESGKFVQFQNCFSLFPPEKWTPPDEFLKLFKRRLEIRLASKRGRDAYIPPRPTLFPSDCGAGDLS